MGSQKEEMNRRSRKGPTEEYPIKRESEKRETARHTGLVYRDTSTLKECNAVKWQHLLQVEAEGSNNKRKQQALLVKYYL